MANYDRHNVTYLSVAAEDASDIPGERTINMGSVTRQQVDPPVTTPTGGGAKWNTGFEPGG